MLVSLQSSSEATTFPPSSNVGFFLDGGWVSEKGGLAVAVLSVQARMVFFQGSLVAPSHPSEAARCASTEDHQAPSPPTYC